MTTQNTSKPSTKHSTKPRAESTAQNKASTAPMSSPEPHYKTPHSKEVKAPSGYNIYPPGTTHKQSTGPEVPRHLRDRTPTQWHPEPQVLVPRSNSKVIMFSNVYLNQIRENLSISKLFSLLIYNPSSRESC